MSVARVTLLAGVLAAALAAAPPAAGQRIGTTHFASVPGPANSRLALPPRPDPWLGEDKVRHFFASAAITAIAYGGARIGLASDDAIGVAIGTAAVAGIAREVHDSRRDRPFSVRDLVWDALGIGVGYLWIREIE